MNEMMLSLFKGYADTVPVPVTLQEVVRLIREDKVLADHTEKYRYYRSLGQKTAASREKAACPCFAVAVRFDGGKRRTDISSWTGPKDGRGRCSKKCVPTRIPCWLILPSAGRG